MTHTIYLKEVNSKNWQAISNLAVHASQTQTIEPNHQSLLEAAYDTIYDWKPYGIYSNDTLVGFAMTGALDETPNTIWLDRFMIDSRYQGFGIGEHALNVILRQLHNDYPAKDILLRVHPENKPALKLYKKYNFKKTGEIDVNGEIILRR